MQKYNALIRIPSNILLMIAIIFFCIAMFGKKEEGEAYVGDFGTWSFNENWKIQGDEKHQDITLPGVWPNDERITIVLENTLPAYVDDGMRFFMRTALQDARFYIDGELRSEYVSDNFEHVDDHLPSSYVMIDLTEEDAGKRIEIQLTMSEQIKLNEAKIGYGNNAWFELLQRNIPVVVAAFILIAGGFFAVIFHFTMGKALHANRAVLFLGEAMIVIGLWIISESQIRQLIFRSPSYSVIFAYMFCELIGGFIARYFDEVQKHKYEKIYFVLAAFMFGQATVNAVLGLTGLVIFYHTLIFSHIWMIVGFVVFLVTVFMDIRTKRIKDYSITAWGMFLFGLLALMEIVGFYVKDFFVLGKYICIGFVVLLVATMMQTIKDEMQKIRMTAELEREKEAAVSANRAKTEFLAKMSHEIRTPVNAVLGMNEMILRESSDETIKEYARDVKSSSMTLLNIINDILDSAKIESGKMELVPVNYEIGSFLNDLYNMINIKAKDKGLELIFDVDPTIPNEYYGDDKRIRQILMNLLTNAVKYTEEGVVTFKVSGLVDGDDAILHFSVKDTGIGIKKEDIGKLYDEFQRLDLERNRNVEGTGLGMVIVQQFLKLMGSEIRIQSEYGKGSEFSFELKQSVINDEPVGNFRERIFRAENEKYRVDFKAPGAKVLVVDDYKMNLKVFRNLLKQTEMCITEAESGRACLELLKEQTFDLIFMDHMMPEMDGIETLHCIRENKMCEGVPVIMLTANAIIGDKEKYLQEGFDGFLTKPIIPKKLVQIILKYLPDKYIVTEENEMDNMMDGEAKISKIEEVKRRLPELDYERGMATCGGDEEFYLELLQDFTKLPVKEELAEYYGEGNYQNYCIRIHGFKNSAYSVGAKTIGDLAYEMEKMTKEGFPTEIETLQVRLFAQFDRICEVYKDITGI